MKKKKIEDDLPVNTVHFIVLYAVTHSVCFPHCWYNFLGFTVLKKEQKAFILTHEMKKYFSQEERQNSPVLFLKL